MLDARFPKRLQYHNLMKIGPFHLFLFALSWKTHGAQRAEKAQCHLLFSPMNTQHFQACFHTFSEKMLGNAACLRYSCYSFYFKKVPFNSAWPRLPCSLWNLCFRWKMDEKCHCNEMPFSHFSLQTRAFFIANGNAKRFFAVLFCLFRRLALSKIT